MHIALARVYSTLDRVEAIEGWKRNPRLAAMHAELVGHADAIKHRSAQLAIEERAHPTSDGLVAEYATLTGTPTPRSGDAA
jgi:hypothetical protein